MNWLLHRVLQRIEKKASASLQSKKALASVFNIKFQDLDHEEQAKKTCTQCQSEKLYKYKKETELGGFGGELLPGLASGSFSLASFLPVICYDCGHIHLYASMEARAKLATSNDWVRI